MDDLYSDLENYQYDNNVLELKNENQELKCKLEEYATTLASLQKDFDKLSAEYKKLEVNYSSLLKTARAEIERKSLMITNLNIEKDKLVIDAMQKRGRIQNRKNAMGNKQQPAKQFSNTEDFNKKENHAPFTDTIDSGLSGTKHHERREHDKNIYSLNPGVINDPNIKENEQKSTKNDLNKGKDKFNNELKKNKEMHSDVFSGIGVTTKDDAIVSLDSTLKNNYDVKENESKSKKFDAYKDREKNKIDMKQSKENHTDVFNIGTATHANQANLLDPTVKDKSREKETESKSRKFDTYKDKETDKYEIKKNKDHTDVFSNLSVASTVSKIRSRRKSMPLLNRGDFHFSSDDDHEDESKVHRFRRKSPLKDDRIYSNKYHDYGRNDIERRVPDLIRMGDKHGTIYDSLRNNYRKSNSRYRESDRYKSRDNNLSRYESNQRNRRYYSPDRPYNIQGEYHNKHRESNDRLYRFDNMRHRTLVSPPPEKYNQHRRSREYDDQRFQQDAVYPVKHKLLDVLEEPVCKRLRSESINKPPDKHLFAPERDVGSRGNSITKPLELSYFSVQSPEYGNLENHPPAHQIKEIKSTSDTKLDDPRLKSKKYLVNTHSHKVELSTIFGRDVDIKLIDTTKWNKNNDKIVHEMPALLKEKPSISEDLVKDIYMDIDNPISNLSLESGEIGLEEEEIGFPNAKKGLVTVNTPQDSNNKSVHNNFPAHDQIELNKKESIIDNEPQTCLTSFSKKYRIPRKTTINTPMVVKENTTNNTRNKVKKDTTKQAHKKRNNRDKKSLQKKMQASACVVASANDDNSLNIFSETTDVCKNRTHKNIKRIKYSPEKPVLSARDTVEGDLELSDETCDYTENSEQTEYDKGNKAKLDESNKNIEIDNTNKDLVIGEPQKSEFTGSEHGTPSENKYFNIILDDHGVQPSELVRHKSEQTKYDSKSKTKPGENDIKITNDRIYKDIGGSEMSECTYFKNGIERPCDNKPLNIKLEDHKAQFKESTSKINNEQKSKDIKNKICDLFGDTSSLITLDDLGIAASTTTKENLNEYAPLFENTQDAVDLNVVDMEKVQTTMKLKPDDESIQKDVNIKITSEKSENADKNYIKETDEKLNSNVAKRSPIKQIFDNVNTQQDDNTVVKTVIISTGVQNNCHTGVIRDKEQEKQQPIVPRKTNDNATSNQALINIKALATSTPYKPQNEPSLSVPEISCSSNNSTTSKDMENNSRVASSNLDIPDVRIIVKRRRKAKGAP